jgi:hypothetical protein
LSKVPANCGGISNFLLTHRMKLDDILAAYRIFENKEDNVLKIGITPQYRCLLHLFQH